MVTPDAVVGGQLDFVLERLRANGFDVRAGRVLGLDYGRLSRMYHHSETPPPPSGKRTELPQAVMTPLYRLAPACVLVLRRAEGDAVEALLRCKGATHPEAAAPGTIRSAGENIIFNFLHCPDDAASAAIELAYLVGAEDAAGLQAEAQTAEASPLESLLGLGQLLRCLPALTGPPGLSFPLTANRLRCRVVSHLALRSRSDAAALRTLLAAHAGLVSERLALDAAGSAAERFQIAQAAHPGIHDALTRAAVAAGEDVLTAGLDALAALYDVQGSRRLLPVLAIAERGVYLAELEKVALDAHRHAFWSEENPPADVSG